MRLDIQSILAQMTVWSDTAWESAMTIAEVYTLNRFLRSQIFFEKFNMFFRSVLEQMAVWGDMAS